MHEIAILLLLIYFLPTAISGGPRPPQPVSAIFVLNLLVAATMPRLLRRLHLRR